MGYIVHEETERGYTLRVEQEEYIDEFFNPRKQFDSLCTMVCEHGRYILGDTTLRDLTGYDVSDFRGMAHIERYIRMRFKPLAFTWLGLYDHSGITMYAYGGPHWQDTGGWDSGTVGFAFVLPETARDMGVPSGDEERQMLGEIKEYDQYLTGDIYGYVIEDPDGDIVDSCCGFYGDEYATQEGKSALRHLLDNTPEQLELGV